MTEDAAKVVETMLKNRQLDNRRSYLVRGRRYERLSSDQLVERWIDHMKAWANDLIAFDQAALNDLGVEMNLREIPPPNNQIAGAWRKIIARSDLALMRLCADPDALNPAKKAQG